MASSWAAVKGCSSWAAGRFADSRWAGAAMTRFVVGDDGLQSCDCWSRRTCCLLTAARVAFVGGVCATTDQGSQTCDEHSLRAATNDRCSWIAEMVHGRWTRVADSQCGIWERQRQLGFAGGGGSSQTRDGRGPRAAAKSRSLWTAPGGDG